MEKLIEKLRSEKENIILMPSDGRDLTFFISNVEIINGKLVIYFNPES